jgi:soluble lytic murein transglycosylase-like protein
VATTGGSRAKVQRGAVYKYEKNGVTHYTNRKPAGQAAKVLFTYIETCFACSPSLGLDFHSVALNLQDFAEEIATTSAEHGVDPALVRAIIHAESAFNPNAKSRAGAQGLMQLIPATASRFGVSEPFVPAENIKGGVSYLAWLSKRFDGDLTRVAAGYNAGEGAVDKYDGVPPYAETQVYVERVGILHERYKAELASAGSASGATASAK